MHQPTEAAILASCKKTFEDQTRHIVSCSNGNLSLGSVLAAGDSIPLAKENEQLDQALVAGDNSLLTRQDSGELASLPSTIRQLTLNSLHPLSSCIEFSECNDNNSDNNKQHHRHCCPHFEHA